MMWNLSTSINCSFRKKKVQLIVY